MFIHANNGKGGIGVKLSLIVPRSGINSDGYLLWGQIANSNVSVLSKKLSIHGNSGKAAIGLKLIISQ